MPEDQLLGFCKRYSGTVWWASQDEIGGPSPYTKSFGSYTVFCSIVYISKVPSGYLKKVLKNHTAHACEGEKLGITCPQKTSISILSAFYGRKVPGENFCPTLTGKTSENATCVSVTARQVRSNFSESKGPSNFAFKRKPI